MKASDKPKRAMKTLFLRPEDGCFDLVGEDHENFISLVVLDQAKDAEAEDCCIACVFISHAEATRIAHWLSRRVARADRLTASETARKAKVGADSHG